MKAAFSAPVAEQNVAFTAHKKGIIKYDFISPVILILHVMGQ